ncbi:MAG TPA: NTP transferase domain-containing protein [Ramlibacter sp.]|nr:NTP transferase domain-containing protein [Ramlibacter sp.]
MSSPVVLVLASGRGERFTASGGQGSKLHALLAGKRVIDWTLEAVKASGLRWHVEEGKHEGLGDCIAAAVRATPDATGWLVLPADLPLIQPATLLAVAESLERHDVVVPHFRGQRGHPVGFDHVCESALRELQGPAGAVSVVRAEAAVDGVFDLELDDEGLVTDIDTLADLRVAERLLASR